MSSKHITIVGAGLAGSLLTVYLARRGIQVALHEQRPDLRCHALPAGRSINLALAHRGIRALRRVGLERQVERLLIPMRGRMLHDRRGECTLQPYSQNPAEVIYSISRSGLNCLLLDAADAAGATLHFQQHLTDVDFAGGTLDVIDERDARPYTLRAEPIIGADGAGSLVRQAMVKRLGIEHDEQLLDHGYKELSIPPGASGGHRFDPNALHIWPRGGYMLIALPNLDGSFTVTLFLPHTGAMSFASLDTAGKIEAFFAEQFADAAALMPHLAEQFFQHPTGRMGTVRCRPWHADGNALLFGDAAHAIVPFHGQGMNCAFEDSLIFDACIERAGGNWARSFAAFTKVRRSDTEAIADMALENYLEMRDQVRDPKFQLQKRLGWLLEKRHPGRFIPRYSMVMFHDMPYAEVQRRGAIQKEILAALTSGIDDLEQVDLNRADELIERDLAEGTHPL
jgi:kynurenine 3-monooxygenase